MSAPIDPRQFGRRHDSAGWTIRGRIEQRRRRTATFAAFAMLALAVVSMGAAIWPTEAIRDGARVLLVALAFLSLVGVQAAAAEACEP